MTTHHHYNTFTLGFPNHFTTTPFEHKFADAIYKYHFGDLPGIKINTIWHNSSFNFIDDTCSSSTLGLNGDTKVKQIKSYIQHRYAERMLFYEVSDQMSLDWNGVIQFAINSFGAENVVVAGNISCEMPNYYYYPYWLLACGEFFQTYNEHEIEPTTFENLYLCYNRKPAEHRIKTFLDFQNNQLLDKGVFTLGKPNPGVTLSLPWNGFKTYTGNDPGKSILVHEDDNIYSIKCDPFSLGNLEVWQKSFLVIVHETLGPVQHENKILDYPLITEKTFKPIIGKRPFITIAQQGHREQMEKYGFEFYDEIPNDPVEAVEFCAKQNLTTFYKSLKPKIDHNYQNYFRIVESLQTKFCL